jgi:hypothetical protein
LAGIQQFDRHTLPIGGLDARQRHSGMTDRKPIKSQGIVAAIF